MLALGQKMFDLRIFGLTLSAVVLACAAVLLACNGSSAEVSESEWEAQRCIWRCLADSKGAGDPRYQACVGRMCDTPHAASARSKAAEYLLREQIARACGGKTGSIDPGSVIERDLTGDGRADLIIHHKGITCKRGGRSALCNAQGCSTNLYVRRGNLLHPVGELDAVEKIRIDDGGTSIVHLALRDGKSSILQWDGREFRPASASLATTGHPLDGFLGGLLPVCDGSPEFDRFRRSLAERYGSNHDGSPIDPERPVPIPELLRPFIGRAIATKESESTKVVVPLSGMFRSLAVTAMEFHFGHQNGINIKAVVFAEPIGRVRAVLGRDVSEGAKRLKAAEKATGVPGEIEIIAVEGRVLLLCDLST
jgi:hypothetical protein